MSPEFLVTSLIVVVTPGTGVLFTLAAGLSRGARASVVAAFGCTLGIVPHIVVAVFGLSALLNTGAVAFELLRIGGVAYLLYLAWSALRDRGALHIDAAPAPRSALRVIMSAVLVNLLNPKLTLFFFAFLPQFLVGDPRDATAQMLALSGVFMLLTFAVFVVYGLAAASVRERIVRSPAILVWMRRAFAAAFVALGLRLALSDR